MPVMDMVAVVVSLMLWVRVRASPSVAVYLVSFT